MAMMENWDCYITLLPNNRLIDNRKSIEDFPEHQDKEELKKNREGLLVCMLDADRCMNVFNNMVKGWKSDEITYSEQDLWKYQALYATKLWYAVRFVLAQCSQTLLGLFNHEIKDCHNRIDSWLQSNNKTFDGLVILEDQLCGLNSDQLEVLDNIKLVFRDIANKVVILWKNNNSTRWFNAGFDFLKIDEITITTELTEHFNIDNVLNETVGSLEAMLIKKQPPPRQQRVDINHNNNNNHNHNNNFSQQSHQQYTQQCNNPNNGNNGSLYNDPVP